MMMMCRCVKLNKHVNNNACDSIGHGGGGCTAFLMRIDIEARTTPRKTTTTEDPATRPSTVHPQLPWRGWPGSRECIETSGKRQTAVAVPPPNKSWPESGWHSCYCKLRRKGLTAKTGLGRPMPFWTSWDTRAGWPETS